MYVNLRIQQGQYTEDETQDRLKCLLVQGKQHMQYESQYCGKTQ